MRTIEIVDYDPGWPDLERLRRHVWPVLRDCALSDGTAKGRNGCEAKRVTKVKRDRVPAQE